MDRPGPVSCLAQRTRKSHPFRELECKVRHQRIRKSKQDETTAKATASAVRLREFAEPDQSYRAEAGNEDRCTGNGRVKGNWHFLGPNLLSKAKTRQLKYGS